MKPAFDEIYRDVPSVQREEIRRFRSAHPYRQLSLNGVPWHYIACGQGTQAIIILGGVLSTGDTAFRTIARLEDRYRIIAPSYPSVSSLGLVVDGLMAILDAEGIQVAHVYGHSLGALVGHVLVRRYPQRVDKLILGSFGLYSPAHVRSAKLFLKLPYPLIRAYYLRVLQQLTVSAPQAERALARAQFVELFTVSQSKEMALAQFGMLIDGMEHPAEYHLAERVERPGRVLLIFAADDRGFSRAEQDALVATYPGAQVRRFASGGHWVTAMRSDEHQAVLDAFLNAHASPSL